MAFLFDWVIPSFGMIDEGGMVKRWYKVICETTMPRTSSKESTIGKAYRFNPEKVVVLVTG